ncbi:MAG: HAD family hydrolase [Anaerolineales bacterium]
MAQQFGTLDLARIKAICLDVDGTLRKTDEQYIARVNTLLKPIRWVSRRNTLPLARSLVTRFEDPVNKLFTVAEKLRVNRPLHKLVDVANPWRRRRARPDYYQTIPNIQTTLEKLSARYPLAVISVRGTVGTRHFLEQTGIARYFALVASGQTARRSKPHPHQIYWLAEQLGIEPQECLIVGDTIIDIRAGVAAGAQTVGVLSGFGKDVELREAGADLILPSIADLPAALGLH